MSIHGLKLWGFCSQGGIWGAGIDWQATDSLRVYAQVEREHFTREINVSAGLKWEF